MAERLTMTSDKGGVAFTFDLDITCRPSEAQKILKLAEKLKRYEDLEEQGRLIILPCKIGDTVWIPNFVTYWPSRFKVNDITIKIDIENTQVGFDVDIVDIGKTVFLTKEEAEAALKGENE